VLAEALIVLAQLAPGANAIDACLAAAERRFNLPTGIATAIARVESGLNPRAINRANRNGTYDLGLMQINSIHQPRLMRNYGIARAHLYNPCVSAFAGAQVLAKALAQTGGSIVPALSKYNTGRPTGQVGLAYAQRVLARWQNPAATAVMASASAGAINLPPPPAALLAGLPDFSAGPVAMAPAAPVITPERSALFVGQSSAFQSAGWARSPQF